jgi:regulatory protein
MPIPKTPRQTALNLLSRREHSATELSRKLRSRDFTPSDIQTAIEALTKEGLLSNTRFTESFVHYRRNKGMGPLRIQAELIERGISEELIEQELDITDNAWFTEVKRVWQKHFKNKMPADFKTKAKHMRFLQYRGFTRDQIESVFE